MKKYILILVGFYILIFSFTFLFYFNHKKISNISFDNIKYSRNRNKISVKLHKMPQISLSSSVNSINNKIEKNTFFNFAKISTKNLDISEKSWWYNVMPEGVPSGPPDDDIYKKYNSVYYLGDTSTKTIYLTFDEGYENGYSNKILDILRENDVHAAFFVTAPFINENQKLILRMTNEGHIVGNHSTSHPSMAEMALSKNGVENEIKGCEDAFREVTGKEIDKFFRPPSGKYSELSIAETQNLGYKTIFWSFAYVDWDVNDQPSYAKAVNTLNSRTHPGGIYLLHAVSKTNTDVLDEQIKTWKNKGYVFKSLYDLP